MHWRIYPSMGRPGWKPLKLYSMYWLGSMFHLAWASQFHFTTEKVDNVIKKEPTCFQGTHFIAMTDCPSWLQQVSSWTPNISASQLLLGVSQKPAEPGAKCEHLYINLNCCVINTLGKEVMGNPGPVEQPESWRGISMSPALLKSQISVQIRRIKHWHEALFWARGSLWPKAKKKTQKNIFIWQLVTCFHLCLPCFFTLLSLLCKRKCWMMLKMLNMLIIYIAADVFLVLNFIDS